MINRVVLNETSYFGRGSRRKLAEELKSRRYEKVLLVSDQTLVQNNIVKMITDVLTAEGIIYFEYLNVRPNPTVDNV